MTTPVKFNMKLSVREYNEARALAKKVDGTMALLIRDAPAFYLKLADEVEQNSTFSINREDGTSTQFMILGLESLRPKYLRAGVRPPATESSRSISEK